MSIQAVAWAIEQHDIPSRPAFVLVALANHASHVDGRCWPSTETIAKEARCSRRAVFGYIAALERNGYVEVQRTRKKSGRQGTNNYWLIFNRALTPWAHLPDHVDPDPPITPEDAEMVEQAIEESSTSDTTSGFQSANPAPGGPVENPPPECKACAPGQSATVCTRQESDPEPSDSRTSEQVEGRAPLHVGAPRGYRKPARTEQVAALQATEDSKPKVQFVFEGSDPWNYWKAYKERTLGRPWSLVTTAVIEGKSRRGWYFPQLYPPRATGPPASCADEPEGLEAELAKG